MNKRLIPEVAIDFTRYSVCSDTISVCCTTIYPIFCLYQKCCDFSGKLLLICRTFPEVATDLPHPSGSCDWFSALFRKLRLISRSLSEVAIDFPHPSGSFNRFPAPFRKLVLISRINDFFRKLLLVLLDILDIPMKLINNVFRKLLLVLLEILDIPYEINKRCLPEVAIGFTWDPRIFSMLCYNFSNVLLISKMLWFAQTQWNE